MGVWGKVKAIHGWWGKVKAIHGGVAMKCVVLIHKAACPLFCRIRRCLWIL